jgi:archaellum component FlaC
VGQAVQVDLYRQAIGSLVNLNFADKTLESVNEAKQEIQNQIHAVEQDPAMVDNPITVSLQLEALKNSDVSADRVLAAIQERLESIEGAVRNVEGVHDLDDVMSKVEDIDQTCDEIKGSVSDLQSSLEK